MRVGIGDIVKFKGGVGPIKAEWDDRIHFDIEVNGEIFVGISADEVEYIK